MDAWSRVTGALPRPAEVALILRLDRLFLEAKQQREPKGSSG